MTTDTPTATAVQRYRQPVERVFAAWTTPALLERWYAPVAGWVAKEATVDARAGGGYRICFGPRPGADRYTETGEYLAFEPNELLRIRIEVTGPEGVSSSIAQVRFRQDGDWTEVTVSDAGHTDEASAATHAQGWQHSLTRITTALLDAKDTIAASIEIDAPIEEVWRFVSEPGWWINDGRLEPHEVTTEHLADGTTVASFPRADGTWRLIVVELRENEYAAFRWTFHDRGNRDATAGAGSTVVEFTLTERAGLVVVDVLESGFADLPLAPERIAAEHSDNTEGWGIEVELLKQAVETGRR